MESLILGEGARIVGVCRIRAAAAGATRITAPTATRHGRFVSLAMVFGDDDPNRHTNGNENDETNDGPDDLGEVRK